MSVYDRAVRPTVKPVGSTGLHVGPGAYDVELTDKSKIRSDGYAPFSSMTSRDTHINLHDTSIAAPGPGQYDNHMIRDHVKGGSTLANTSSRFVEQEAFTPGPGAYQLRNLEVNGKSKKPPTESRARLVIVRKPEAPSIPTPGQAYGFEENEDGTLRRQDPPERDTSIGPAFYSAEKPHTKVTETYKGIHWGKYSTKRTDFSGKAGPGPAEYDPQLDITTGMEHLNLRNEDRSKKFDAKIPRYHEWVVKEEEKKSVPGPGRYDINSGFDPEVKKLNQEGIEVEHPPFLSQSRRFGANKNAIPAPGTYNDPRTALGSLKKITGLKRSPFGQTAVRFAPTHHTRKTPGPGAYNKVGIGQESMKKAYIESTRRGVFGTTSARINAMVKRDDYYLPGPAHYAVKEATKTTAELKRGQPMGVFSSLSNRVHEDVEAKAVPPPGSYDVDMSYRQSQLRKDPAPPRNETAAKRKEAFATSSSRFAPPRDIQIRKPDAVNPSPAAYDPNVKAIDDKGGKLVYKERRFRDLSKEDVPGPGTYEYSPLIQDTVLKGTFNATLNNPITQRIQGSQPIKGQQAFLLGI
ncbi:sperm-tail PG-rich repeat-containing protein 2-like [Watersipora subatra]|uniref:sperm-tail PG-rich repeat-containing protein 2-like n=1 Tax=Watersipora subatra TaxID=2589382 RepID=UPI00355B9760